LRSKGYDLEGLADRLPQRRLVEDDEDVALVEAAQRGSSAGIIERGWVLGGAETLIGYFQDYVRDRLGLDQA